MLVLAFNIPSLYFPIWAGRFCGLPASDQQLVSPQLFSVLHVPQKGKGHHNESLLEINIIFEIGSVSTMLVSNSGSSCFRLKSAGTIGRHATTPTCNPFLTAGREGLLGFCLFCVVFKTRSLCVDGLLWHLLCRPGWPRTHRYPPASAS